MAGFIWENNGVEKFDFDILAKYIDSTFIENIKKFTEQAKILGIDVHDDSKVVQILIVSELLVQVFTQYKDDKKTEYTILGRTDIDWIGSVMKNA